MTFLWTYIDLFSYAVCLQSKVYAIGSKWRLSAYTSTLCVSLTKCLEYWATDIGHEHGPLAWKQINSSTTKDFISYFPLYKFHARTISEMRGANKASRNKKNL